MRTPIARRDRTLATLRAVVALGVALAGCTPRPEPPDLSRLYSRVAEFEYPERNPVIVIPGILGSKLVDGDTGTVVWGAFGGGAADPETPDGARLVALPMAEGAALPTLVDSVRSAGALDRVKVDLFGWPVELSAYAQILATLGIGGYRDQTLGESGAIHYGRDHFTCFQFDYDWRRDNVENARRLDTFIREKRAYVQREIEKRFGVTDQDVHFDIIAHSMGGLVTRYFLRYGTQDLPADGSLPESSWAGARYVDKAVLIGTPNAGSIEALHQLVEGADFGPLVPEYEPAVIGTFPSLYQLLPRGRHAALVEASDRAGAPPEPVADLLDPALWERMGWGLAAPSQDRVLATLLPDVNDPAARRRIALDHLRKSLARAARFHAALDAPGPLPPGSELHLIASDAVATAAVSVVDPRSGALSHHASAPGDGTVLRTSALMDERVGGTRWRPRLVSPIPWTTVTFLFTDHLGLTQDPAFTDNVLYLLLERPG
ncbi:MAG: hypothetical protein U0610_15905 [bacterium]